MNKSILSAALLLSATGVMAQETYESAQLATQDLNGTARYVGMGGAMEALGADISTMSTNPAGIGLFRKSWAGVSGGLSVTQDGNKNQTTNVDFNQLGFVYSFHTGANSSFNFGFNYHKNSNFNQIISAVNSLDGNSSVNKLMYKRWESFAGNYGKETAYNNDITLADQLTYEALNSQMQDALGNDYYLEATGYAAGRERQGYISEFDFNLSGNINERCYLGITLGLKDVRYKHDITYAENLVTDATLGSNGTYTLTDARRITGTGVDIKFGVIFRPLEESPFRIGLYIHTPTWYRLTCENNMQATAYFPSSGEQYSYQNSSYDYRINTPWRFGLSLGHTFGKSVAVGATYEYSDYSNINNKIKVRNDYYYNDDYYGGYDRNYENDTQMNYNTSKSLNGVHLLKVGAEIKPAQNFAIRLGYNYESAIYDQNGCKGCTDLSHKVSSLIDSYYSNGAYYSTYDYINWKATHRLTFGLGYTISKNWTLDLAYQYSTQKGEYHPFTSLNSSSTDDSCYGTPTDVKMNRHQVNCTIGYRF